MGRSTIYRYDTATNAMDIVDQINSQEHGVTSMGVGRRRCRRRARVHLGLGRVQLRRRRARRCRTQSDVRRGVEWMSENPAQLDGPFTGGALAGGPLDARAPLFLSTHTNSGYDGATGSSACSLTASGIETSSERIATNWAGGAALDVVDYDNDGDRRSIPRHELRYTTGWLGVYDFWPEAWRNGRQVRCGTRPPGIDITHADLTGDGRAELVGHELVRRHHSTRRLPADPGLAEHHARQRPQGIRHGCRRRGRGRALRSLAVTLDYVHLYRLKRPADSVHFKRRRIRPTEPDHRRGGWRHGRRRRSRDLPSRPRSPTTRTPLKSSGSTAGGDLQVVGCVRLAVAGLDARRRAIVDSAQESGSSGRRNVP